MYTVQKKYGNQLGEVIFIFTMFYNNITLKLKTQPLMLPSILSYNVAADVSGSILGHICGL